MRLFRRSKENDEKLSTGQGSNAFDAPPETNNWRLYLMALSASWASAMVSRVVEQGPFRDRCNVLTDAPPPSFPTSSDTTLLSLAQRSHFPRSNEPLD